jgi:hypothetical protein
MRADATDFAMPGRAASASPSLELDAMLANRRWCAYEKPFRHVRANDVFVPQVYENLVGGFEAVLARGLSERSDATRFARLSGYDAYGISFSDHLGAAFRVFVSRAWHDLVAALFDVETTGDIRGGLHHHRIGSRDGQIHNDLNPGWFVGDACSHDVNVANLALCNYFNGVTVAGAGPARETVRAVAMLYYLDNGASRVGDGGETGLYRQCGGPVGQPDVRVAPIDNSILLFECTPWSYHAFLGNPHKPRNSIIMWLHRPKSSVVARWGQDRIVTWPKS